MINIAIFERSIKRKVVLNSKIFVINLSRWGLQQQLWLREQSGWWQLRVKSKWNLTSSDLSCRDPGHSTRHKLSLDSCENDTMQDKAKYKLGKVIFESNLNAGCKAPGISLCTDWCFIGRDAYQMIYILSMTGRELLGLGAGKCQPI